MRSPLIDTEDLAAWSPAGAGAGLPRLVRMLVAHSPGVMNFAAPGATIGAVGTADCSTSHPFIPAGRSVWALSIDDGGSKDEALALRLIPESSGGTGSPAASLVLVTHHRFGDKEAWCAGLTAGSPWRSASVVDAVDLQTWLETLPIVHLWASELLGRPVAQAATVGHWWSQWSRRTAPPTPADLLLAGRSAEVAALQKRAEERGLTRIYGQSAREAAAFAAAAVNRFSEGIERVAGLVAIDADGLRLCCAAPAGTLIIALADEPDVADALDAGHHVVAPIGAAHPRERADIILPPIPSDEAAAALLAAGLPRDRAERLAGVARRSLLTFRRSLAHVPGQRPTWAQPPNSNLLAPLMLVGSWLQQNDADIRVVGDVTQRPWDEVERELVAWVHSEDPPWRVIAGNWYLTDPSDAWELLHSRLIASDIERWQREVIMVLSERDPALQLPPAERHLAGFRDVHRQWSAELRRGLAEGLALLGTAGATPLPGGTIASDRARSIVAELLSGEDPCELWESLGDVLPRLAEAAPQEFLDALAAGLAGDHPPLRCLFREPDGPAGMGPWSPHIAVVAALETVSWSGRYLERAAGLLARLEEIDPGGRSGNRPADSLRRIFLPWLPRTSASLQDRTAALDSLDQGYPEIAWTLRLGLLPSVHGFTHTTHRPRFRVEWIPDYEGAPRAEWEAAVIGLVEDAVASARALPSRWADIIPRVQNLTANERYRVFDALAKLDPDELDADDRLGVWQALTEAAARHGQHRTARWALPEEDIGRLTKLAERFDPVDDLRRYALLFTWRVDLPGVNPLDHEQRERRLGELRDEAALNAWRAGGLDALVQLARIADEPFLIGRHAAAILGAVADPQLAALLHMQGTACERMSAGWVSERYVQDGWPWTEALTRVLSAESQPEAALRLLLAVPATPGAWTAGSRLRSDLADSYWRSMNPWSVGPDDARELVPLLIEHGRAWSAIQLLSARVLTDQGIQKLDDDTIQLIVKALYSALAADVSVGIPAGSPDYEVDRLLGALRASDVPLDLVAELEWAFFPLLEGSYKTPALFSKLDSDPEFFAQLMSLAFRSADQSPGEGDASEARTALNAYEVLGGWRTIPGTTASGIDGNQLMDWVRRARDLLIESGRRDIGDQQIGQVLSASPPGDDGAWPHESVRNVIEAIDGQHIIIGFRIGTFNARGVTSRGMLEGGAQERALAARYRDWATALRPRWLRTASALDDLARGYDRDAQREDEQAARWGDRL
jgi:hypothetical protein